MSDDIILRPETVEGFEGFHWDRNDYGAWAGPLNDWEQSHANVIRNLPRHRTVVQAGGNLGLYPVLLSQHFDTVHTYEADPDNFEILEMNLRRHGIGNCIAWNYALGETIRQSGIAKLNPTNVGMNKIDDHSDIKIRMINLDSAIDFFKDVDLLWLDIEGYEFAALNGAMKFIEKFKPMIMIERADYSVENLLAKFGYERKAESMMDTIFEPKGYGVL